MPFPIQRIQTDRGSGFFAESVQRRLMSECIKFRPIPPRSPHLNGKVERSQLTDLNEFWSNHPPAEDGISQRIEEWQIAGCTKKRSFFRSEDRARQPWMRWPMTSNKEPGRHYI